MERKISYLRKTHLNLKLQKLYDTNFINIKRTYELESLKNIRGDIWEIPKEIGVLKNLKEILIYANKIKIIPKELCLLTNLEKLDLSHNQISVIPKEFMFLNLLKQLDLTGNKISSLPKEFELLINLRELKLGDNNISKDDDVMKITCLNLFILDLHKNSITNIPDEISNLLNLEKLDLSNNKIKTISEKIGLLKKLRELPLYNNALSRQEYQKIDKVFPPYTRVIF
jgi:Leucine-rich repeat (LRR) protein